MGKPVSLGTLFSSKQFLRKPLSICKIACVSMVNAGVDKTRTGSRTGPRTGSRTGPRTGPRTGSRTGPWIGSRKNFKIQNSILKIRNWFCWANYTRVTIVSCKTFYLIQVRYSFIPLIYNNKGKTVIKQVSMVIIGRMYETKHRKTKNTLNKLNTWWFQRTSFRFLYFFKKWVWNTIFCSRIKRNKSFVFQRNLAVLQKF